MSNEPTMLDAVVDAAIRIESEQPDLTQQEPTSVSYTGPYPGPCPECGKICLSPVGMERHRRAAHGAVDKNGKVQCPLDSCTAWVTPGSVGRHLRHVHKVFGGVTGVRRGRKPGSKNKPKPTSEVEIRTGNGHKADKLPQLTAEQITRAAAEALWPEGIPHDSLTALLRWNIQTHYFLAEVTQ